MRRTTTPNSSLLTPHYKKPQWNTNEAPYRSPRTVPHLQAAPGTMYTTPLAGDSYVLWQVTQVAQVAQVLKTGISS